jgi:hypothetical protein
MDNSNYNSSREYNNLPKIAKAYIDDYYNDRNLNKLIDNIFINLKTQKTIKSKFVRKNIFKTLLTRYFNLTKKEIHKLIPTEEETIEYHNTINTSFKERKPLLITNNLLSDFLQVEEFYLMISSGCRFSELFGKDNLQIKDNKIYIKILKKRGGKVEIIEPKLITPQYNFIKVYNSISNDISNIRKYNRIIKRIMKKNNYSDDIINNPNYKTSTHLMRNIYSDLVYKFYNTDNKIKPNIIKDRLHHSNFSSSQHYNNVKFSDDFKLPKILNIKTNKAKKKMTNKELRELLISNGINKTNTKGFNRLTKPKLINLINDKLNIQL